MKLVKWTLLAAAAMALSAGVVWANRMAPGGIAAPAPSRDGGFRQGFEHHGIEHGGGHRGFEHRGFEHHGWHHRGSIVILAPTLFAPAFDDPFYRAPPTPLLAAPPTNIERGEGGNALAEGNVPDAAPPGDANAWYYCAAAGTYYPYIKECPAGWVTVPKP